MSTETIAPENSTSQSVTTSTPGAYANSRRYTVAPAVSIFEQPGEWVIQADLPGVSKENAKINTEDNFLTITGERTAVETTGRRLHKESRPYNYRRTFELPRTVDVSRIAARLENGVLSITLPKVEKVLPRTIEVTD
jgi:HSP20 family protein